MIKSTKILPYACAAVFLVVALPVWAASFGSGDEYVLGRERVINDNLYVVGGSIVISGEARKDLIAAGGGILINGPVGQDILAGGGSINILSNVGGDVRVAGGNIIIGGPVNGDVVAAGGSIQMLSDTVVSGDIIVAGGKITIDGSVFGNVRAVGGDITINGNVRGDVFIDAVDNLVVGSGAQVLGNIVYGSDEEASVAEDATIGGEITRKVSAKPTYIDPGPVLAGVLAVFALFKVVAVLIAGILAVIVFKRFSAALGAHTISNFWIELVRGFVVFIVIPAAIIVLFMTIIGSFVAAVGLLLYGLLIVIASIYAGVLFGAFLAKLFKKRVIVDWKWAVLGVVVLGLINLIPFVGWLVASAFFLASLGYISKSIYQRVWLTR